MFIFGTLSDSISFYFNRHSIRSTIKQYIKSGVSKEDTEIIRINKQDIHKEIDFIHSKEFRYKGKLYDIISSIENSDYIEYIVINDAQEESLIKNFTEKTNGSCKVAALFEFVLLKSFNFISYLSAIDKLILNVSHYDCLFIKQDVLKGHFRLDFPPPKLAY